MEELEEVVTIMIDNLRVPKIVMLSVSSEEKWASLLETVDSNRE